MSGSAKADEGLLRLGHSYMLVALDFTSNGEQYRVRREFTLEGGKAQTHVDFGIVTQTGVFKALTEKTIRSTQATINQIVGLDYDSFINSVFLRQGQSNEFSKKSPKERKDILATILGLDHYEELRKRALEKIRITLVDKEVMMLLYERLQQEISKKITVEQELASNIEKLATIVAEEKKVLAFLSQSTARKKNLEHELNSYKILEFQHQHTYQRITELTQELTNKIQAWRLRNGEQRLLAMTIGTTTYQQQKQQHEDALRILDNHKNRKTELQELLLQGKAEEYSYSKKLETQELATLVAYDKKIQDQEFLIKTTNSNLEEIATAEKNITTEKKAEQQTLSSLELTLKHLDQDLRNYGAIEKQFEKRKNFYHLFIARGNRIQTLLKDLAHRKELMHDTNPSCPLCEQNLSAARKRFMHTKLCEQEALLVHQKKRLMGITVLLKTALIDQHNQIEAFKKLHEKRIQQEEQQQELIKKLALLEQKVIENYKKIEEKKKLLTTQQEELAQFVRLKQEYRKHCTAVRDNDLHYLQLRNSIKNYEQELANVTYDEQRYQELKNGLKRLHELELALAQREHTTNFLQQTKQEISRTIKTLKSLKKNRRYVNYNLKNVRQLKIAIKN